MKTTARHLRIFISIAVALLCFVVCRTAMAEDVVAAEPVEEMTRAMHEECDVTDATLIEKEDNMLHAAREMGRWAIPSTSTTLQGAAGRMFSIGKILQRINRINGALSVSESRCTNEQDETLRHTLQTKRFHTGYYIYYRCQMRC